jgi:MFS family permease
MKFGVIQHMNAAQRTSLTILVAALGYFVDVFDLQLFSILRVTSLQSMGLSPEEITNTGAMLINWQMAGFLVGGVFWGMLGDKKGRVMVLFGTILLYSVSNIANAFVTTIPAYAVARFFTGMGLAGEVGAGVTLLSELLPKEKRGYATTIMMGCGVLGPVGASLIADVMDWRTAYIAGGVLGLLLLTLRVAVCESGLFSAIEKHKHVAKGNFLMLFTNAKRLKKYLCCIGIGIPNWFVAGVLIGFTPEIGVALGTDVPLKVSRAVITYCCGLALGCFISGLLSQLFQNRKKVIAFFLVGLVLFDCILLNAHGISATAYYGTMAVVAFFMGYWTVFMTTTAEQFGTNLRATATTSAANFVRGSLILDIMLAQFLKPYLGLLNALVVTAVVGFLIAAFALWKLPESFNKDLDFNER